MLSGAANLCIMPGITPQVEQTHSWVIKANFEPQTGPEAGRCGLREGLHNPQFFSFASSHVRGCGVAACSLCLSWFAG